MNMTVFFWRTTNGNVNVNAFDFLMMDVNIFIFYMKVPDNGKYGLATDPFMNSQLIYTILF